MPELLMVEPDDVTVFLVRHGQAAGDVRPGEIGPPLTKLGLKQADRIGKRMADEKFDHIYSSDMARAYETCTAIRKHHPDTPYTVDKRIREVQTWHIEFENPPRRKSLKETLEKELKAVNGFIRKIARTHRGGEKICIAAHGNLIRLFVPLVFRVNPRHQCYYRLYNTALSVISVREKNSGGRKIHFVNSVTHLLPSMMNHWGATRE